jgi:hypothetical protein
MFYSFSSLASSALVPEPSIGLVFLRFNTIFFGVVLGIIE